MCVQENGRRRVSPFEILRMHYRDAFSRRVVGEIDVGGSADRSGVWISGRYYQRVEASGRRLAAGSAKQKASARLSPRSRQAFQNKEPRRCWFSGGQYVNQWLAVVTMSRPPASASSSLRHHRSTKPTTKSELTPPKGLEDM